MIHLALQVLAFFFLCFIGLVLLGIVFGILGAIGKTLGKLFAATPHPQGTRSSKTPFALGHDPIEPGHDPRTCPICLGAGHGSDPDLCARAPRGMSTDELYTGTDQERKREGEKRQIEVAHQQIEYKHIPGLPWGDPGSYAKASTADELEQARLALQKQETERRERETLAMLEQERRKLAEEKREQEARDFLAREAARVIQEREERSDAVPRVRESEPPASAPVVIIRPASQEAEGEVCKCGYPGCLGHEVIDNHAIFPGFTSEAAMAKSPHEFVCFNVEMSGVAGNPSDGAIPASAVKMRPKPRE